MDSSINFKGAFLLKQPTKAVKTAIVPNLGKRKQIIQNVGGKGDILYVLRDKYDKNVADFIIQTKNIKFKYFPGVNTKCGFDDEKPEEAKYILNKCATKIFNTKKELEEIFFSKQKEIKKPAPMSAKDSVMKALNLSYENCSVKSHNGIIFIRDNKTNQLIAKCSSPDSAGISYAYVEPKISDDPLKRYAIRNGQIFFTYSYDSRTKFKKNYSDAVKYNRELNAKNSK